MHAVLLSQQARLLSVGHVSHGQFLKLIARQIARNHSPAAPVAIRAGPVVARAVDTPALAAGCVRDAFFTDGTGYHRLLFFLAGHINIYSRKNEKSQDITL